MNSGRSDSFFHAASEAYPGLWVSAMLVRFNALVYEPERVGSDFRVARDRVGRRKDADNVRVAAFEVPEVVEVAIGQDNESAALWTWAYLLACSLPTKGFLSDDLASSTTSGNPRESSSRKSMKAVASLLEVLTQVFEIGRREGYALLQSNVGGLVPIWEEPPSCLLQQVVDSDARCCLVHVSYTLSIRG